MQCGPDGPIYSAEKVKLEQDDPEGIGSGTSPIHGLVIVAEGRVKKTG
jgi:hypothetical protein